MRRSFYVFASGLPGAALLLLRCSVAAFLITVPSVHLGNSIGVGLLVDGLAVLVFLGLQSRVAGVLAAIVAAILMIRTDGFVSMPFAAHALDAVVLAMAGPGAYSIDSRLFGRRTVHLPD